MNEIKNKPQEVTIEIFANIDQMLYDKRSGNHGLIFGTLKDVITQYGMTLKIKDNHIFCTSTKQRMYKFIEKLHFACIKYIEL